ncbi:N-acetyl-gamma-glutamyl-phosphate reductase [Kurthia senegalensis]|uniref:N-acetyl-gamma-glutamyl-phosphate reductase n=1 Tax=Kurthia senegalensis TaxID=1033740 RepID=UPI000287C4E9|nr:N-acetyl-gamma-glutamyl-phosphate reductase [Kurthia senegalensis]
MKVGIIGATGYGGLELMRLLHNHSKITSITLFTSSDEGTVISDKYPHLKSIYDGTLQPITKEAVEKLDVLFMGTPSGVSGQIIPELLNDHTKIIDLSGDLRLKDISQYEAWYGKKAAPQQLVDQAVYGLSEWTTDVKNAQVVANPGCYPTAVLLSVLPLIKEQLIDATQLIIDAKSGISGSGNKPSQGTHFTENTEATSIYKMNKHQHIPEIEQAINIFTGTSHPITFSTHLVPMIRGIIATSYAPLKQGVVEADLHAAYAKYYEGQPFVRLVKEATKVSTNQVRGTNYCDIHVNVDERTNRVTIVSVIDNLVKGAAGQAIQNMNTMFGYEETEGLTQVPLFI